MVGADALQRQKKAAKATNCLFSLRLEAGWLIMLGQRKHCASSTHKKHAHLIWWVKLLTCRCLSHMQSTVWEHAYTHTTCARAHTHTHIKGIQGFGSSSLPWLELTSCSSSFCVRTKARCSQFNTHLHGADLQHAPHLPAWS